MLYLRSWLEEYIDLSDYTNDQLKHILTMKSGEVEEIYTKSDYFDGKVVVGKIENVRKHEGADKLKIFDVNLGLKQPKIQIVSAAPNVTEGLFVPVAMVGAKLPMGTILERQMRGEKSQGMCCGQSELMLETEYSKGLWELVGIAETEADLIHLSGFPIRILESKLVSLEEEILGKSICEVLPELFKQETIIDIKYLADKIFSCGNHLGLALDLSICLENPDLLTQTAKQLLDPAYLIEKIVAKVNTKTLPIDIEFDDKTGYTNTFGLYNLKIDGEYLFPKELQQRMFLTERNLIGGLADLSNYLVADIGHPNHFFSSGKIYELANGQSINWSIKQTTDDKEFVGLGQMKNTVIPKGVEVLCQDDETILTLPGITGGELTKSEPEETEVFIEIANFSANRIAKSSFDLGYRSDGVKIYASGVNLNLQFVFLVRLLNLLEDQSANFNIQNIFFWLSIEIKESFNLQKTHNLLQKATKILENESDKFIKVDFSYLATRMDNRGLAYWLPIFEQKLNIIGKYSKGLLYPNSFYGNISTQEDLFEELARLVGFENLSPDHLKVSTAQIRNPTYKSLTNLKKIISDFGFQEVINRPFIPFKETHNPDTAIKLQNPYDSSKDTLRDSLMPSLLKNTSDNLLNGVKNPAIFENSKLYTKISDQYTLFENSVIQGIMVNEDPYYLTSLIYKIAKSTNQNYDYKDLDEDFTKYGQGFSYSLENRQKFHLLQIKNYVKKQYGIPLNKTLWFFSLDNLDLLPPISSYKKYYNESSLPTILRNYSYSVDKNFTWQSILAEINQLNLLEANIRTSPKERFSDGLKDIISFEVEFVSYARTFTGEEISSWEKALDERLGDLAQKR